LLLQHQQGQGQQQSKGITDTTLLNRNTTKTATTAVTIKAVTTKATAATDARTHTATLLQYVHC
jgi:hypothetical protein